jgi:hypothetical protein
MSAKIRLRERETYGVGGGAPPVFGPLLGPADPRRGERLVRFGRRGHDASIVADDDRARATGPDVDSKHVLRHAFIALPGSW